MDIVYLFLNIETTMISYRKTVYMFALLLFIDVRQAQGYATASMNCLGVGKTGQSTTLVCTISGTVQQGIFFLRPNNETVVSCNGANTRCRSTITGYTAVIDSYTQITLTINSFSSEHDAGTWTCQDANTGVGSSMCNKLVARDVTTSIDCMGIGKTGQSTTLVCTISGNLIQGIYFLRPNSGSPEAVVRCNPDNTQCILIGSVTGYSYVINSNTQTTLTINSFNPANDSGTWTCQDGNTGVGTSTCNKLVANTTTVLGEPSGAWCIRCAVLNSVLIVGGFIISF